MTQYELVLYHGMASTCSKKVRMCLYEKGLAFESHLLDLQKFEQHEPGYLAINPNGVVPTLVHAGQPIIESSVIIAYLDDCFPEPSLTPAHPYARYLMRLWLKYSDEVAYKAVYAPTWHRLKERAREGLADEKLAETLSRVPSAERRERWEKMAEGGYTEAELQKAYEQMSGCLDRAEAQVRETPWLAGEEFSLADIAILPFIVRIANLRPDYMEGEDRAALRAWYARCRERPAYLPAFEFKDDPRAATLPNI